MVIKVLKKSKWVEDDLAKERPVAMKGFFEEGTFGHKMCAENGKVVSHMKKVSEGESRVKGTAV